MEPPSRLLEYRPKRPPWAQPARRPGTAALMEAMRTARLRFRRRKRQLQMVHDPVHDGILRNEGDDLC